VRELDVVQSVEVGTTLGHFRSLPRLPVRIPSAQVGQRALGGQVSAHSVNADPGRR
jgi:hypothetical protein